MLAFPVAGSTTAPGAVLLGIGMGLVTPEFLLMFVKLSQHCQRGTANTMHLLSWETGISIGIAIACYTTAQIPESLPVLYRFCSAMARAITSLLPAGNIPLFQEETIQIVIT